MRHSYLLIGFVLCVIASCSSSSSSGGADDCSGGFPSAGDDCSTEGQTCLAEGPPCSTGNGSSGSIVYTCSGGKLIVSSTPNCVSGFDGGTHDATTGNDATIIDDAAIDDAGDDASD